MDSIVPRFHTGVFRRPADINVAKNDDGNEFRTGSSNNPASAHAQREIPKVAEKRWSVIVELTSSREIEVVKSAGYIRISAGSSEIVVYAHAQ